MITRTTYRNREEWLAGRSHGLGASDIGAVLGVSKFKTPIQLWREKTGAVKSTDISDSQRVQFGNDAETPLREMFRLMHPEYELTFEPFTILRPVGRYSFLSCTPDGELVERSTGRKGIYESKTATCLSRADWEKWNCQIPQTYFAQIIEQMFCGEFSFAVVWALLLNAEGDGSLRAYRFERGNCEASIQDMLPKAETFWRHVEAGTIPTQTLILPKP